MSRQSKGEGIDDKMLRIQLFVSEDQITRGSGDVHEAQIKHERSAPGPMRMNESERKGMGISDMRGVQRLHEIRETALRASAKARHCRVEENSRVPFVIPSTEVLLNARNEGDLVPS